MAGTTFAQERAEKNVSVDCGKGKTFHKVHGFIGCCISHSDDFQGAIDHIIDDDLFKLHLPIASMCREHALALKEWIGKPSRKTIVDEFLAELGENLSEVVTCLTNGKKLCAGREKMWTSYHKLRTSENFRMCWKTFFSNCLSEKTSEIHPVLYQRLTEILYKKMLGRKMALNRTTAGEADCDPLTITEENALRYAAGYVCRQVKKKIKRSAHPHELKEELLSCMDKMREYGEEAITDDSSRWTCIIDRGGLWHINDNLYRVFYAMEEEVRMYLRKNLHRQTTHNEPLLCDIVTSNENVLFHWCIAMAACHEKATNILLKELAMQWITVRGFAYTSGWIEQYKQGKKTALQKKKSLRTSLQSSEHDK